MKRIENTSRIVSENPMVGLLMAHPAGIEASEKRGQQQLVESDRLPVNTHGNDAGFIALGFTFGEADADDPIFRPATLPEGWKREASDHSMWSHIVDERGFRRVAIFYKAAFYDRSANMSIENVGQSLVGDMLSGKEPITPDSLPLEKLTADERTEFLDALDDYRKRIAEYPDIYRDYAPRIAEIDSLLNLNV